MSCPFRSSYVGGVSKEDESLPPPAASHMNTCRSFFPSPLTSRHLLHSCWPTTTNEHPPSILRRLLTDARGRDAAPRTCWSVIAIEAEYKSKSHL